jgi:hypothetical protein
MKHIKRFESLDFKSKLEMEKKLKDKFEKDSDFRKEDLRKELSGKHLPNIQKENDERDKEFFYVKERREITQRVIDGLVNDLNNKPGWLSFKEELLSFLDEFPKE